MTLSKYKVTKEIMRELGEEERAIINYIIDKGKISKRECVELLKSSPVTAYRYLKSLEEKGVISKRGRGKNIHYVLT